MHGLRELQRDFAASVLRHDAPVLAPHILGPARDARALLYANTVHGTLGKALESLYPVLLRLLGGRCFDGLARHFIRETPSLSGDLHGFGGEMPDFIAATPLARDYAYLPDVARLEWSVHRVFHARDAVPLDVAKLAAVAPEDYDRLCFVPAPASALLASPWPIHRIWEANQPERDGEARLDAEPTRLLVLRRATRIEMIPLDAGAHAFLSALAAGQPLPLAVEAALAAEPEFDPQAALASEVTRGSLTDFLVANRPALSGGAQTRDQ